MPPIETITRPHRNRISVSVPREYSSYSFQVILVPLGVDTVDISPQKPRKTGSFVDALCLVLNWAMVRRWMSLVIPVISAGLLIYEIPA